MIHDNFFEDNISVKTTAFLGGAAFEAKHLKRCRSGSISGRLRAASDLEESGIVNKYEKGMLKDYIISGDTDLEAAIEKYEVKGDVTSLRAFIDQNYGLPSMELLDGIELGFLNMYAKGRKERFDSFDGDFNLGIIDDHEESDRSAEVDDVKITDKISENILSSAKGSTSIDSAPRKDSMDFVDQELINFRRSYRTSTFESTGFGSFSGLNTVFDADIFNPEYSSGRRDSFSFTDITCNRGSIDLDDNMPTIISTSSKIPQKRNIVYKNNGTMEDMGFSNLDNSVSNFGSSKPFQNSHQDSNSKNNSQGIFLSSSNNNSSSSHSHITSRPPLPIAIPSIVKKEHGSEDNLSLHQSSRPVTGQGFIGAYSPESRRQLIERFHEKKKHRVWTKKVKYDVRKNFADSRLRIKGRFVKKEDEEIMRVLLT
eukprot:gene814-1590_t